MGIKERKKDLKQERERQEMGNINGMEK